jgi:RNA polymerase sigma factor (TIGR02999 family)
MNDLTAVLNGIEHGDPQAASELLPLVYADLRRLAAMRLAQLPPGQTLQPTALVHEAWLRLVEGAGGQEHWNSRNHFFAAAAEAMRRILVGQARRKAALKRGGGLVRVDLDHVDVAQDTDDDLLLLLDEALDALAERDPIAADLIKLRFFVGLTNVEAAELLGVPERSAKRAWAYARAWLYREIKKKL